MSLWPALDRRKSRLQARPVFDGKESVMTTKKKKRNITADKQVVAINQSRCGLCGKTKNLTKTECCDNWICDDEDQYIMFSYSRNSCSRNHRRFTLCGFHHTEGHAGDWKNCPQCKEDIKTEMYVYYGTNEYNFEKLENPPDYEPTKCSKCGALIRLGTEGYTQSRDEYWCEACAAKEIEKRLRRAKASSRRPKGHG